MSVTPGLAGGADSAWSGLFTRDERRNRTLLSIPLPESVNPERISNALSTVLTALTGAASSISKGAAEG
jgi:hypothetical protein